MSKEELLDIINEVQQLQSELDDVEVKAASLAVSSLTWATKSKPFNRSLNP